MTFLRFIAASSFVALVSVVGCGGDSSSATDAGQDVVYGHKPIDAQAPLDAGGDEANQPWDRMTNHGAGALAAPHLRSIYIGTDGVDLSPNFDAYLSFLVSSPDWWGAILAQYGVTTGAYDGATYIPTASFLHDGDVVNGFINWLTLEKRVAEAIHATGTTTDAGTDDGGTDAGAVQIPKADGYVVFLPDGVNVDLGQGETTCAQAGGYHSYDQLEPYSIIPPCGRQRLVISHEVAEMVTDPEPGTGWFSDADIQSVQGGEIGDLCNFTAHADGQSVTALWSNKDGDCEPQQ